MPAEDFAAGVDALLPILTILATGAVTTFGAWLTAKMTRKNDQVKIQAEKEREELRITHEKELAQGEIQRAQEAARAEQAAAAEAASLAAAREEAARAKSVAELFFGVILYIDEQNPERGDDPQFDTYFADRWPTFEVDLRRAIGSLTNGSLRNRLISIVDAATDTESASYHGSSPKAWAAWLMDIGADLAMTASRMEEPDAELLGRYESFSDSFAFVNEYRQELWETARSHRQDQLRDIRQQETSDQ